MRGCFLINGQRVWNRITEEGEQAFLKMIARDDQSDVAAGDDFYLGLCGNVNDPTLILGTLTGEPAVSHGYSRKTLSRDGTGWPTLGKVNGIWRIQSAQVTFTAAGGDFTAAISRCFLASTNDNTGKLFAISGPLASDLLISDGQSVPVKYELYLR